MFDFDVVTGPSQPPRPEAPHEPARPDAAASAAVPQPKTKPPERPN